MKNIVGAFCIHLSLISMPSLANIPEIEVIYAKSELTSETLSLSGSIEAKQDADLAPLQSGVVAKLYVEQGDQVNKGQKLIELDDTLAQLSLAELNSAVNASLTNLRETERQLDELLTLKKQQFVAETLIEERRAQVEVAKAELAQKKSSQARQQEVVARHALYAPFAGVISTRYVDLGEWVTQQNPVYTLIENSQLRLKLAIPQEYYSQLASAENVTVSVTVDALDIEPINASLDNLVSAASSSSRTVTSLVNLPDINGVVPGMSALAKIEIPTNGETLVWLPKAALKSHPDGGSSVFYVENSKVNRQLVRVSSYKGDNVGVLGVRTDLPYVSNGVELLKDGQQVKVTQTKGSKL